MVSVRSAKRKHPEVGISNNGIILPFKKPKVCSESTKIGIKRSKPENVSVGAEKDTASITSPEEDHNSNPSFENINLFPSEELSPSCNSKKI